MATAYPTALDTTGGNLPDNKTDATVTATDHKAHHNNLADAVIAVQTALGTSPAGSYADVKTRLNAALYTGAGVQTLQPGSDVVGLIVKGFSGGSTSNLQDWENSAGAILAFIDHAGGFSAQTLSVAGTLLNSTHLSDSASLARLASPTFTGTPAAPTPTTGDSSTKIATTAFVAANGVPSGAILAFGSSTPPSGWLSTDGSSVLRATYPALFAVIGTTFGSADGTHFNLPDIRGRVPVGLGTNAAVSSVGTNDGVAVANRRPQHQHTPHTHTFNEQNISLTLGGTAESFFARDEPVTSSAFINASDGGTGVGTDSLDAPAFIVLPYIIKT